MNVETLRKLFAALSPSPPAIASACASFQKGDHSAAVSGLARYFRERPAPIYPQDFRSVDRGSVFDQEAADSSIDGRIQGGMVPIWHTFPNGEIDWTFNATDNRPGVTPNVEWQWQICRMKFWSDLAIAYRNTGDERYAQAWVKQLRSFIRNCPLPSEEKFTWRPVATPRNEIIKVPNIYRGSAWRTIECGIRMHRHWPNAFFAFRLSPHFTDADIVDYLYSVFEHAAYLKKYPSTGNWLTMEMSGLFTIGALFPEFQHASEWRAFAITTLEGELSHQFVPDGAQTELTPSYHNVAVDSILAIPLLAKHTDYFDEIPAAYLAGLEKPLDYNVRIMAPDGTLPRFNDCDPVSRAAQQALLAKAAKIFPQRQDFRWVASGRQDGAPPAYTSTPLRWAGYFVMRSGWEADANYAVLDAGPLGSGHIHQDKLNLVLWAYGRELLYDNGGGSYEDSKWRKYAEDTHAHNTVLVDDKPQRRLINDQESKRVSAPINARWESSLAHDFAAETYAAGYGDESNFPASHTRRVLFIKPDLFIVADTLVPNDSATHAYEARWHLKTRNSQQLGAYGMITTDLGLANLAIIPLDEDGLETQIVSAQEEPFVLGWNVEKDVVPTQTPATTVVHKRTGQGIRHFFTLLTPIKPHAGNQIKTIRSDGRQAWVIEFHDRRQLRITIDPDPAGSIFYSPS